VLSPEAAPPRKAFGTYDKCTSICISEEPGPRSSSEASTSAVRPNHISRNRRVELYVGRRRSPIGSLSRIETSNTAINPSQDWFCFTIIELFDHCFFFLVSS